MLYNVIMVLFISTHTLADQDPYNILLTDSTEYTIDISFGGEEYEMIHDESFKSSNDGSSYNSIRSKLYEKLKPTDLNNKDSIERYRTDENDYSLLTTASPSIKYWYYRKGKPKKYVYINNGTDYKFIQYNDFLKEYDAEGKYEEKLNYMSNDNEPSSPEVLRTIHSLFKFDLGCKNCSAEELSHIGIKSICCLAYDYRRGEAPRVLAARLWRILKIWLLVYLFIALPLWCMKGWCCCCLCCKFFKPRETIEEAKEYFLRNPPGSLRVNNREIRYLPTESERDACQEFEHLLRTI